MAASSLPTPDRTGPILISGTRGLIGSALAVSLESDGTQVLRLVRGPAGAQNEIPWDPEVPLRDGRLTGLRAVVHLAGAPIATRWTAARRAAIRDSRVRGTESLVRGLTEVSSPPPVLLCASAVGYYGDTGDRAVDESGQPGDGFLADLCRDWEAAAQPARNQDTRVVNPRFGLVLAPAGGALAKMLPAFRMGLGGPLGSGSQYMSWITLADAVRAIRFLLDRDDLNGPVNLVSPTPVTNRTFTRALGVALNRPAVMSMPAPLLRLVLGGMADEALLVSNRVLPGRLLEAGFTFQNPELKDAFTSLGIGRKNASLST